MLENETLNLLEINLKNNREPSENEDEIYEGEGPEDYFHLDRTSGLFVR